jgi:hypothetical protein
MELATHFPEKKESPTPIPNKGGAASSGHESDCDQAVFRVMDAELFGGLVKNALYGQRVL